MAAETTFKGLTIRARYTGSKKAAWAGGPENWNHHKVTVSNGRAWCSFDFWASIADPEIQSRRDLINALGCFLMDAQIGRDFSSADEVMAEFGYENERDARRVLKACEKSWEKARRVVGNRLDYLNEEANSF